MKIFLYGKKGAGKSTIVEKALEDFEGRIAGFATKKIVTGENDANVYIFSFDDKEKKLNEKNIVGICGETSILESYPENFDTTGVELLRLEEKPDIIVMDELGILERKAEKFKIRVMEILDTDIRILGVLKDKSEEFLNAIKNRGDVVAFEVTKNNRAEVLKKVKKIFEL